MRHVSDYTVRRLAHYAWSLDRAVRITRPRAIPVVLPLDRVGRGFLQSPDGAGSTMGTDLVNYRRFSTERGATRCLNKQGVA
jgi:hypothetical protein